MNVCEVANVLLDQVKLCRIYVDEPVTDDVRFIEQNQTLWAIELIT